MVYTEEEYKFQSDRLLAEIEKSYVVLGIPKVDSKKDSRDAATEFLKKVLKCDNPCMEFGDFDCSAGVERDNKEFVFIKFKSKYSRYRAYRASFRSTE